MCQEDTVYFKNKKAPFAAASFSLLTGKGALCLCDNFLLNIQMLIEQSLRNRRTDLFS